VEPDGDQILSIAGGLETSKESLVPELLKNIGKALRATKDGDKTLTTSFSLELELVKQKKKKVKEQSKELVFENENQAILSCDQLRVLHKWWDTLKPALRLKVENREAYVKIIGYTTTSGDDRYNTNLGEKRAIDVKNLLDTIIGKRAENEGIADIRYSSKGEISDSPDRYVKIIVIER